MTRARPIETTDDLHVAPHPHGLGALLALVDGVEQPFALTEVRVRAHLVGDVARTVVEQRFHNPFDRPLEAVHLFPLPEDGAVVELELLAGEVVVRAECRERQAAEAEFAAARAAGHRAALLSAERADVHTLRVTRIPPGEAIRVRLVIVERLERVDGRYRWRFPTVIAPRYLSGTPTHHDGPGVLPATDHAPDADRLQPPLRLAGGTRLDLEVEITGPVRKLACAQHAFGIELADDGVRLAPSASSTLDRDFVLAFSTAEADRIVSRAWTDGSHTLVVVEPPSVSMPRPLPRDAVFVVDISGSMSGVKMSAAKRALTAALHGLVDGDRFRLIAFDDRVEAMSPDFLVYDAANLKRADAWIGALRDRGGTEMLPAIQEALRIGDTPGRSRSVLFITDGQAWNEAELTAAVANRRQGARFFTFGIDTAVNGALLKRLARVGGGTCELTTPSDDIEEALANLEARFGSPLVDGLSVDGFPHAADPAGVHAGAPQRVSMPAPSTSAPAGVAVFTGRPATLLVDGAPTELTVTGVGPDGPVRFQVRPTRLDFPIGALWARERIAALEDRLVLKPLWEEALRPEILQLALQWSIASRYTSFVAVDRGRVVAGDLLEQVQPVEAPAQWASGAPAGGAVPYGAPAPAARSSAAPPMSAPAAPRPSADAPKRKRSLLGAIGDALGFGSSGAEPSEGSMAPAEAADLELEREEAAPLREQKSAPAPARSRMAVPEPVQAEADPAGQLARTQGADGSFGGEVARTAAALLALVLLGHTRRKGSRRRTVLKAATWLDAHRADPLAALALDLLERAEAGEPIAAEPTWSPLYAAGAEGAALSGVASA